MTRFDTIDEVVLTLEEIAEQYGVPRPYFTKVSWMDGGEYSAAVIHSRRSDEKGATAGVAIDASGEVPELYADDDVHVEKIVVRYDSSGDDVFLDMVSMRELNRADYPVSKVLERQRIETLDAPRTLSE